MRETSDQRVRQRLPDFRPNNTDCVQLLAADFTGLHAQHAGAWASFNAMLQIVMVLEALPWVAAGTLVHQDIHVDELFTSPLLEVTLAFSAVLGIVGYKLLAYNRSLILFYARALNHYRGLFASAGVPVNGLPVSHELPRNDGESRGVMGLLTNTLSIINASYFAVFSFAMAKTLKFTTYVDVIMALLVGTLCFLHVRHWHEGILHGDKKGAVR